MISKKHISKNSGYNIRPLTVIMECFSPKIIHTKISFEPKQYLLSLNKFTEHYSLFPLDIKFWLFNKQFLVESSNFIIYINTDIKILVII